MYLVLVQYTYLLQLATAGCGDGSGRCCCMYATSAKRFRPSNINKFTDHWILYIYHIYIHVGRRYVHCILYMYAYVFISESIKSSLLHLVIKRWGGIRLISINNKHSKSLLHIKPLFSYNLEYLEVLLPTSLWHSLQPLAMFGSNCSMFVLIYPPAQKVYGTYTISKFLTMYILTMVQRMFQDSFLFPPAILTLVMSCPKSPGPHISNTVMHNNSIQMFTFINKSVLEMSGRVLLEVLSCYPSRSSR